MKTSNNNPDLFSEIKKTLDAIADPGRLRQLSRIEADLIRERLRNLYDQLSDIGETEKNIKKKTAVEPAFTPEISPAVVEENIQKSETDLAEIDDDELLPDQALNLEPVPTPAKAKEQPDLFSLGENVKKVEKQTVADKISEEKQRESVAEKLHKHAKVNTLKNAIGINEKFYFINELFEGNLNEYNAAIDSLDEMDTLEEGMACLDSLSGNFNWNGHDEAVEQLKEFVVRKLTK